MRRSLESGVWSRESGIRAAWPLRPVFDSRLQTPDSRLSYYLPEAKAMNVEWMRGCATALVTPFGSDGSVDIEQMRALVERQVEGGVRLLVPCGTTGESATMSDEENRAVIRATVEVA